MDDTREWLELFTLLLRREPLFEIIGHASNGQHALQIAEATKPTVVILDINMPVLQGIEAAKRIMLLIPDVKIVFVSCELDRELIEKTMRLGVFGYVSKFNAVQDLLPAIRSALRGESFVSRRLDPSF